MFATVFNYTAFHKRYDDNYAGIAIPAFYSFFSSFFDSNNICAANFAISSLFSIITLIVFSAFLNSAFSHDFSLTDINSQNIQ